MHQRFQFCGKFERTKEKSETMFLFTSRSTSGLVFSPTKLLAHLLTQRSYEIGTNPLFDDRAQEVVHQNSLLRLELPKQEPDRVYGLQATDNLKNLLSSPVARSILAPDEPNIMLEELVRSCPFKDGDEPLLFPFLVLEAKSEKSFSGFGAIQTQSAFPIFALLKLQEDLLTQAIDGHGPNRPLVWFFANRGDAWRVYGCCLSDTKPTNYVCVCSIQIVQLPRPG